MEGALLVLLLLLVKHLSAVSPSCTEGSKVIGKGEEDVVVDSSFIGRYVTWREFFLHYEKGFESLEVKIAGSNGTVSMSFDLGSDPQCFPHSTYWWAIVITCGYFSGLQYVWCVVLSGNCRWHCNKRYTLDHNMSFRVVARGSSAWIVDDFNYDTCSADVSWLSGNRYLIAERSCKDLPTTHPTQPNILTRPPTLTSATSVLTAVLVVVAVVAVVMAVGIVILMMKLRRVRQQRLPEPSVPMAASQTRPPRQAPAASSQTRPPLQAPAAFSQTRPPWQAPAASSQTRPPWQTPAAASQTRPPWQAPPATSGTQEDPYLYDDVEESYSYITPQSLPFAKPGGGPHG